jgi:hypothetical protein
MTHCCCGVSDQAGKIKFRQDAQMDLALARDGKNFAASLLSHKKRQFKRFITTRNVIGDANKWVCLELLNTTGWQKCAHQRSVTSHSEFLLHVPRTSTLLVQLEHVEQPFKVDAVTIQIGTLNLGQRTALRAATHVMMGLCQTGGANACRAPANGIGLWKQCVKRTAQTLAVLATATQSATAVVLFRTALDSVALLKEAGNFFASCTLSDGGRLQVACKQKRASMFQVVSKLVEQPTAVVLFVRLTTSFQNDGSLPEAAFRSTRAISLTRFDLQSSHLERLFNFLKTSLEHANTLIR